MRRLLEIWGTLLLGLSLIFLILYQAEEDAVRTVDESIVYERPVLKPPSGMIRSYLAPRELIISDHWWEIRYILPEDLPYVPGNDDPYGYADPFSRTILLDRDLPTYLEKVSLRHEMLHAILAEYERNAIRPLQHHIEITNYLMPLISSEMQTIMERNPAVREYFNHQ